MLTGFLCGFRILFGCFSATLCIVGVSVTTKWMCLFMFVFVRSAACIVGEIAQLSVGKMLSLAQLLLLLALLLCLCCHIWLYAHGNTWSTHGNPETAVNLYSSLCWCWCCCYCYCLLLLPCHLTCNAAFRSLPTHPLMIIAFTRALELCLNCRIVAVVVVIYYIVVVWRSAFGVAAESALA